MTVRFTEEEYAALKGKCEIAGMKMEPFVRALVEGCRIKPAPPNSYNKLRQQLAAIGNNLNQLTHIANATGRVSASQLDRAQSLLEDIKPYLHKLSPKECEVMICLYIDRLSIADTATKLKIKPDTVSTHKHNAINKIRKAMGEH